MYRNTRSSFACARCYKRKKRCDRGYPSCSQCTKASAQCIGLDRGSEAELPRSLITHLQDLVAQLELEKQSLVSNTRHGEANNLRAGIGNSDQSPLLVPESREYALAYALVATTAQDSAPMVSMNTAPRSALPYSRAFFMGAELPYPLAFQNKRPINFPSSHDGSEFTKLPGEVADKLIAVYTERILPQYPLFLKQEVLDMFQRFKNDNVTANEQFVIFMIKAIVTLSSKSRDYRKLVSLAESLRRDAFTCLDFGLESNNATVSTIQQLLLLAQYGYLLPSTTNLWQVVGDATRIALELGLHQVTPTQAGLDETAIESRKRLFWTLYSIERSVAITSHRPYSVSGDQIHVTFPIVEDDEPIPDHTSAQGSYIRFIDRLQFLQVQSEICSVNIGMRPMPSPGLAYETWMTDIETRVFEIRAQAATPRWCDLLEWHSLLLLHMPCRRNPNPSEDSVFKYFDAAVRIATEYWELAELDHINNPWHAAHHCYEAGNLILYSLWYFPNLVRINYTTKQVFEIVHQISGFFILIAKQWPATQQCGALFDGLRKGALSFFREAGFSEAESSLEAKQLKELVFRENADLLYAHDQSLSTDPPSLETMFPDFEIHDLSLGFSSDLEFLDFFRFPETSNLDGLDGVRMNDDPAEMNFPQASGSNQRVDIEIPRKTQNSNIDEVQLRAAMQRLPVCSHCKKRRIKCDVTLPACRNCTKLRQECYFWDNALSQETSREHIHALQQQVESLVSDVNGLKQALEPLAGISSLKTGPMSPGLPVPWTRDNEFPTGGTVVNILCRPRSTAMKSPSMIFFGPTSSFARLVMQAGVSLPLSNGALLSLPQRPRLAETVLGSLIFTVAGDFSKPAAEDLTQVYYRSIEICYPILGQNLIRLTLESIYTENYGLGDDGTTRTRFNLILAISLALLSRRDERLSVAADAYFCEAVSGGLSTDQFVRPTNKSLQLVLLMCVYAWICPGALDIWRLLGHASRMCLDIIEVHGSDKTDSANAGKLYRTFYALETQLSVAFGRPRHLPDGKEVPASSPDPNLVSGDELSTLVYNLARLQNRFHKDMLGREYDYSGMTLFSSAILDSSWMSSYAHDMRIWLEDWNARVEALFVGSPAFREDEDFTRLFKLWGQFQQCQALTLAKLAADRRGQALISDEDELTICKQLLEAADGLLKQPDPTDGLSLPCHTPFVFPLAWTQTHSIFNATMVILQHLHAGSPLLDAEMKDLFRAGLKMLSSVGKTDDKGTMGLVACLQNMYNCSHLPMII